MEVLHDKLARVLSHGLQLAVRRVSAEVHAHVLLDVIQEVSARIFSGAR